MRLSRKNALDARRVSEVFRSAGVSLAMVLATLAALEIFLRVADLRELREGVSEPVVSAKKYTSALAVPASSP